MKKYEYAVWTIGGERFLKTYEVFLQDGKFIKKLVSVEYMNGNRKTNEKDFT